jgi:hypothetical protein
MSAIVSDFKAVDTVNQSGSNDVRFVRSLEMRNFTLDDDLDLIRLTQT